MPPSWTYVSFVLGWGREEEDNLPEPLRDIWKNQGGRPQKLTCWGQEKFFRRKHKGGYGSNKIIITVVRFIEHSLCQDLNANPYHLQPSKVGPIIVSRYDDPIAKS